ncbi:class I SAM-dependent methyltransferase, partial [Streptomyces olivaceus]|uniref:class I SAM-dependent methyltransferase n=1 Tax=Streptomyces olivaceus TaxID=47716 RepID=UPI00367F3CDA
MNTTDPVAFWDGVHASHPATGDPRPNARLVETVTDLPPGDALDLGLGSGGDALWLARRGWRVTAVDISGVAAERLTGHARAHGLGDLVDARRHDLGVSFPEGLFDLVTAHYFHTPFEMDRSAVLRTAAQALRPGGRLLVVGAAAPSPRGLGGNTRPPHPPPPPARA